MKRFISVLIVMFICTCVFAQKRYFVYIQAEPEQAFFVKRVDKTYPSTANGYLTLSRLIDSSYSFVVGFPQNKWPDQHFTININGRDHGFLLKNFGEKGWGLFDLQSMAVIMSTPQLASEAIRTEQKEVSAFTAVLAKAANDPSLTQRTIVPVKQEQKEVVAETAAVKQIGSTETKQEVVMVPAAPVVVEKKEELPRQEEVVSKPVEAPKSEMPVVKSEAVLPVTDTIVAKTEPAMTKKEAAAVAGREAETVTGTVAGAVAGTVTETETMRNEQPYKRSVVTRRAESSTSDGFGITFTDMQADGRNDTIRILIPNPKTTYTLMETPSKRAEEPVQAKPEVKETKDPAVVRVPETAKQAATAAKCTSVAADADFMKLRRKMAAGVDDDEMVEVARKTFKGKCFTTEQVKNLSTLFLNDAGKYKFFDAAYSYIADPSGFAGLETELKEEYYKSRFRAMLR